MNLIVVKLVSLNVTEKAVWWLYRRLNAIRVVLNNAATSRIMENPAVIPINQQLQICIYVSFCVTISLFLNRFFIIQNYLIKKLRLICYFKFGLRTNQRLYPNLGVRPLWCGDIGRPFQAELMG